MEKGQYVYILECRDSTYYTGYTTDVDKRLETHNLGKGAKYTRSRRPCKLVYVRVCESKSKALKLEYKIKQMSRKNIGRKYTEKRMIYKRRVLEIPDTLTYEKNFWLKNEKF